MAPNTLILKLESINIQIPYQIPFQILSHICHTATHPTNYIKNTHVRYNKKIVEFKNKTNRQKQKELDFQYNGSFLIETGISGDHRCSRKINFSRS